MPGYVESHVIDDVARAYEQLMEQHRGVKSAATEILRNPHWSITRRLKKSHFAMQRLVTSQVRELFSGESGRKAAAVLAFAPVTLLLGNVTGRRGVTRYSIGPDGLLKVFFPKRQIFRKKPRPVVSQASIEELCSSVNPRDVYVAVYRLLDLAAAEILQRRS